MPDDSYDRWISTWLDFVRAHSRLWDQVEAQMRKEYGLTMARYDVLATLAGAGGRMGLGDLAASTVLSPSGISKLLDRMEQSGLVRREPDPIDARSAIAAITPRGQALVKRARAGHHEFLQHVFGDKLDDRDLSDLARIMGKIGGRH
jgi:DNA-binding MarR family transcriptional regulator